MKLRSFKIGDRVRALSKSSTGGIAEGDVFDVVDNQGVPHIRDTDGDLRGGPWGPDGSRGDEVQFELVEPEKTEPEKTERETLFDAVVAACVEQFKAESAYVAAQAAVRAAVAAYNDHDTARLNAAVSDELDKLG